MTASGNTATVKGGGIFSAGTGGKILHSTITANTAPRGVGLAYETSGGTLQVGNTILAANITGDDVERTAGSADNLQSLGYNLVGRVNSTPKFAQAFDQTWVTDPGLGALANNGGTTLTHALNAQPGDESPAVDSGKCDLGGSAPAVDQRGSAWPARAPRFAISAHTRPRA